MPLPVRPDYVNPLTTREDRGNHRPGFQPAGQNSKSDKVSKLQSKQQQLQNELLMMKTSGTDTAGASVEKVKLIEKKLEEVSANIKSAQSENQVSTDKASLSNLKKASETGQASELLARSSANIRQKDYYEKGSESKASPGIYQAKPVEGNRFKISFAPYKER